MATARMIKGGYIREQPYLPPLNGNIELTYTSLDADRTDFEVLVIFDENVTGLTRGDFSVSVTLTSGDSLDSERLPSIRNLRGENAVWAVTVRPHVTSPQFAENNRSGTLTITLAANAVDQGNAETTLTLNHQTTLPVPAWESMFNLPSAGDTAYSIVSVDHTGVHVIQSSNMGFSNPTNTIKVFDWDGNEQTSKRVTLPGTTPSTTVEGTFIAGTQLMLTNVVRYSQGIYFAIYGKTAYRFDGNSITWSDDNWGSDSATVGAWAWTDDGRIIISMPGGSFAYIDADAVLESVRDDIDLNEEFQSVSFASGISEDRFLPGGVSTSSGGRLPRYEYSNWLRSPLIVSGGGYTFLYQRELSRFFNRGIQVGVQRFIYAYKDGQQLRQATFPADRYISSIYLNHPYLYALRDGIRIERWDTRNLEVPQVLPVPTPIQVRPGDTIDLEKYFTNADDVEFSVGYEKPTWLSLSDSTLTVSSSTPAPSSAWVQVNGINHHGLSDELGFYIYIRPLLTPAWKDFTAISVLPDQSINLYEYVDTAESIAWKSGFTRPSGFTLTNGILTFTARIQEKNEVQFTATSSDNQTADKTFDIRLLPSADDINAERGFKFHVEIEGNDISNRLAAPGVSFTQSLDILQVNRYVVGDCTVPLRNNDGHFRSDVANNFWDANDLNPNGFLNRVNISVEFKQADNTYDRVLFFEGQIVGLEMPIRAVATLRCLSSASRLTKTNIEGLGIGIPKIAVLTNDDERKEPIVEGAYSPESSLAPLDIDDDVEVYHNETALTAKDVANSALGVKDNTGVLSESSFNVQGGILDTPLLLRYKSVYRFIPMAQAFEKLSKSEAAFSSVLSAFDDISDVDAHVSVRASLGYNTEEGRIVRLPSDWMYNATTSRLYFLMSSEASYIKDRLIEYSLDTHTYKILHEFTESRHVIRMASGDFNTFYFITTPALDFSKSDALIRNYDSRSDDADIKIIRYVVSTSTQSDFITSSATYRPQLGTHFFTGFYLLDKAAQGIVPDRHGNFIYHNSNLYYRYANDTRFGVARATSAGAVTSLFSIVYDEFENGLNFAFCVNGNNTYIAYAVGSTTGSTLRIIRHNGTTTSSLLNETRTFANLTDLDESGGGWLGVSEFFYDSNMLYLVVSVSRGGRDIAKTAGSILYSFDTTDNSLSVVDTTDFVHHGFCGIVNHDSAIHYFRAPAVAEQFIPKNVDLENYNEEDKRNYDPDFKGSLHKINNSGVGELISINRFDDNGAFRGLMCRPIVFDDSINMLITQGNPHELMINESTISQPAGVLWCGYGEKLRFSIDVLPTSGQLDSILTNLASQVNATLSSHQGVTRIESRRGVDATLNNNLTARNTNARYRNASRSELPDEGYILIGNEFMSYDSITNNRLRMLDRGVLGTSPARHSAGDTITFLESVIETDDISGDMYWNVDMNHLYNTIKDSNLIKVSDTATPWVESPLDLSLDLDNLRIEWIEFIASEYLDRFKDIRFLLNLGIKPERGWKLRLGERIGLKYATLPPIGLQIMRIEYTSSVINISAREISPK